MQDHLKSILDRLDARDQLQPLSPTMTWEPELEPAIERLEWVGKRNHTAVITLIAGLHLRNDSLDRSHTYAQEIEHDATGAYWHGIMHRMEGDYSNAKYWFTRAGKHPVMTTVQQGVAEWLRDVWDEASIPQGRVLSALRTYRDAAAWTPSTFVDLIQWLEAGDDSGSTQDILEHLQHIELTALFEHTLQAALAVLD